MARASDRPIATSRRTAATRAAGGSDAGMAITGASISAMSTVRPTRRIGGAVTAPKNGVPMTSMPGRTSRIAAPPTSASCVIGRLLRSSDQVGQPLEQRARKAGGHAQHPGEGERKDHEYRGGARQERQDVVLNGRDGLQDADDNADHEAGDEHRNGNDDGSLDCLPDDPEYQRFRH